MLLFSALALFAQAPAASPGVARRDPVVATVNGKPMTAADIERMIQSYPTSQRPALMRQKREFLQGFALMELLADIAEKEKLEQKSPYKEQFEDLRRQVEHYRRQLLMNAVMSDKPRDFTVTPEEQKQYYQSHSADFHESKVKLIYIPFSAVQVAPADSKARKTLTEAEARTKADSVVRQGRAGADFVKLVKEYSEDPGSVAKDGDFGLAIRKNTDKIPPNLKAAILAAKQGEITDAIRGDNGFYIFRIESSRELPYEEVRNEIYQEIQNQRFLAWLEGVKKKATVKIEDESYFRN